MSINKKLNEQYFETKKKHKESYDKGAPPKYGWIRTLILLAALIAIFYLFNPLVLIKKRTL